MVSVAIVIIVVNLPAIGVLFPIDLPTLRAVQGSTVGCPAGLDLRIRTGLPRIGACGFA